MEKDSFIKKYGLLIVTGLVVGAAAVLLTAICSESSGPR